MPALFLGRNTVDKGLWAGRLGRQGYQVYAGSTFSSLPSYCTSVTNAGTGGQGFFNWESGAADARAIRQPPPADQSTGHVYAYYGNTTTTTTVNINDSAPHVFTAYFLDSNLGGGRAQTVELLSPADASLDGPRAMSGFGGGVYMSWIVAGPFKMRLVRTLGSNAVHSGVFFDHHPADRGIGEAAFGNYPT